jgi:exopolysaccharide biosynthesis polyprenyl glycosylphosphotransferase
MRRSEKSKKLSVLKFQNESEYIMTAIKIINNTKKSYRNDSAIIYDFNLFLNFINNKNKYFRNNKYFRSARKLILINKNNKLNSMIFENIIDKTHLSNIIKNIEYIRNYTIINRFDKIYITSDNSINSDLLNRLFCDLPVSIVISINNNFERKCNLNNKKIIYQNNPVKKLSYYLKRPFDIVVGLAGFLVLLPLLALISILIKIDSPGPILFRQRRGGIYGRQFRIFKFRTMTTLDDGKTVSQAVKGDRRVTKVGALLRRTNLDELPQLLNVILGDMSLVGPRPHALAHDEEYIKKIPYYSARYKFKPGITGWSQVNGYRGETDTLDKMKNRVDNDIYYINNWSLLFDLYILFLTVASIKSFRNAY